MIFHFFGQTVRIETPSVGLAATRSIFRATTRFSPRKLPCGPKPARARSGYVTIVPF
jgi:hypothetical protein